MTGRTKRLAAPYGRSPVHTNASQRNLWSLLDLASHPKLQDSTTIDLGLLWTKEGKACMGGKFDNIKVMGAVSELEVSQGEVLGLTARAKEIDLGLANPERAKSLLLDELPAAWQKRVSDLVATCQGEQGEQEKDQALIQLVKLDKRYLGEELVVARVLKWWMQVRTAQKRSARQDRDEAEKRAEQGEHASQNLQSFANAVKYTGKKSYWDLNELLSIYENDTLVALDELLDALIRVGEDGSTENIELDDSETAALAARWELTSQTIATISLEPEKRTECRQLILAAWFGVSDATVRDLLIRARNLDKDGTLAGPNVDLDEVLLRIAEKTAEPK